MTRPSTLAPIDQLPNWVPAAARHYLVHTETGQSIRALARENDCHASTILRQVRRFEGRRDDPLIDDALRQLSTLIAPKPQSEQQDSPMLQSFDKTKVPMLTPGLTEDKIDREAARVLRRLCETGAVLAAARDMEVAVVVRSHPDGSSTRTATVRTELAQAMALRDWITCAEAGARIARYHVTAQGRSALKRLLAEAENRARTVGYADDDDSDSNDWSGPDIDEAGDGRSLRQALAESPLAGLARRRDRDGQLFLSRDLVAAGERLREDFELAQMGPKVAQDWDRFLTGPAPASQGGSGAAFEAHDRVKAALHDLGPGLGDVVLRCCCYLEGLEVAEKRLGWAARSGKIVLRIALLRLKQHYERTTGKYGPKIG